MKVQKELIKGFLTEPQALLDLEDPKIELNNPTNMHKYVIKVEKSRIRN